jgi:asparagine synthase (glutamine-hydrolysing)
MCGIAGIITSKDSAPLTEREILDLRQSLEHRGPDSAGLHLDPHCALGIRRLSVIDLETGDQPIRDEAAGITVVMNGEIYNYKALRESLTSAGHRFRTAGDTEALVAGYKEWGIRGLLERLNGMFAFALLDAKRGRLFLGRDRFGEKPLYYWESPSRCAFASELMALLVHEKVPFEIDQDALYYYLALHFVPGAGTIVRGIRSLPPAHFMEIGLNDLSRRVERYWWLGEEGSSTDSYDEALEQLRSLLRDAVRSRMVADVPVGAFLSGGVDSSTMVKLMGEQSGKVETFSIGFEDGPLDESDHSREVARQLGTNHHHYYFDIAKVHEILPRVVAYMDEPVGDPAYLPVYWLSKEARRHVKVVLSGEGADEIFGGYDYYRTRVERPVIRSLRERVKSLLVGNGLFADSRETVSGFPVIANHAERLQLMSQPLSGYPGESWIQPIVRLVEETKDRLRAACLGDILTWLPDDLLMKLDKMTMASSLEGRAPYLDHRLAGFAFRLPASMKMTPHTSKKILRDAFSSELPKGIGARPKQGFVLPMGRWLRQELRPLLLDAFHTSVDDGLDNEVARSMIEGQLGDGVTRERLVYALLAYRLWYIEARSRIRAASDRAGG